MKGSRNSWPAALSGAEAGRLRFVAAWFAAVALTAAAAAAQVRLGIDVLEAQRFAPLKGRRIGLIANQTSVDSQGRRAADILRAAPGVRLVALFAPEHGLEGKVAAGREFPDSRDAASGLPVFSLYGPKATRAPSEEMLKGIDLMVYDVQDVGLRSYTYISTLGLAIEACAKAGVDFLVLDRPDPLGGTRVEGPVLDPKFRSFVGQWPIPLVYGMTPGELALMIAGEKWISKSRWISVIPMAGWQRKMTWRKTGLAWVPPSPAMTDPERPFYLTATAYLAQIGGVSVGFGTPHPYQCVAAPWWDARLLAAWFARKKLPGIAFDPVSFTPRRGAYAGRKVHGVRLRLTDPAAAPLVPINFYALDAARELAGKRLYAEAARQGRSFAMFDKLMGTDKVRRALAAGVSGEELARSWAPALERFRALRAKYLIYR